MNQLSNIGAETATPMAKNIDTIEFGLLLLPGFPTDSYFLFASVAEFINRDLRNTLFNCMALSENGGMIEGSCGAIIDTKSLSECENNFDYLLVFSSSEKRFESRRKAAFFLSKYIRAKSIIGAIGGGVFALADTGHLNNKVASVHWRHKDIFKELFMDIATSDKMFEVDDRIWTSSGRTAALDLAIHVVKKHFGAAYAVETAQEFNHSRLSDEDSTQVSKLLNTPITGSHVVNQAIILLRGHIEELITMDELCKSVQISKRQLERQFSRHCGVTPTKYYRNIRLSHAREMLKCTNLRINEIALATGFSGSSYFSIAYRRRYRKTPTEERNISVIH